MKRKFACAKIRTWLIWIRVNRLISSATGTVFQEKNEFAESFFASFLKKYMPQKHLVQVNLREKLNFHDFYFQLRGAGYEDLTMIKSEIFYCTKISKKLSKIICFMQNHELLVFYCGHQSKVHRQKCVSTNRQLIMANLIYITLDGHKTNIFV